MPEAGKNLLGRDLIVKLGIPGGKRRIDPGRILGMRNFLCPEQRRICENS